MTYETWLPILLVLGKPGGLLAQGACTSGTGKCIRCGGGVGE